MNKIKLFRQDANLAAILLLIGAVFICYFLSLFNGFVNYDDHVIFLKSTSLHHFSFERLVNIFQSHFEVRSLRFNPLLTVIHMIVVRFAGVSAFWFHVVSVFFHLGATVMAFLLAKEITGKHRLSFICALIFGIHPIHVEPVVWASSQGHLISAFFYLSSIYVYTIGLNKKQNEVVLTILSFILFVIGGLCLSTGVITLSAILILLTVFKEKIWSKMSFLKLLPFVVLSVWFFGITFRSAHATSVNYSYFNAVTYSLIERIHMSVISIAYYVWQIIAPYSFSVVYPQGYFAPFGNFFITIVFILCVLSLIIKHRRIYHWKYISFGVFFFLIVVAPFLKIYSNSDSITNDRYVYLASFGLFLILAEIIDWVITNKKKRILLNVILIAGCFYLTVITWTTILNWRNGQMLWGQVIKMYPKAYPAYVARAEYYNTVGKYSESLADCDRALSYNSEYVDALMAKGQALIKMNLHEDAIKVYSRLLEVDNKSILALNNRGTLYSVLNKSEKAILDFSQSIKINENQINPYYNRGAVYFHQKQYDLALADFNVVMKKQPDHNLAYIKIKEIKNMVMYKE